MRRLVGNLLLHILFAVGFEGLFRSQSDGFAQTCPGLPTSHAEVQLPRMRMCLEILVEDSEEEMVLLSQWYTLTILLCYWFRYIYHGLLLNQTELPQALL